MDGHKTLDGEELPFLDGFDYDGGTRGDMRGIGEGLIDPGGLFHDDKPTPSSDDSGGGSIIPILLLGFLGCFIYQHYQKHAGRSRTHDHEEGAGLMDFCRSGRSAFGNRTSDMLDRRRDKRLAANDYSRGRHDDDDDDGML